MSYDCMTKKDPCECIPNPPTFTGPRQINGEMIDNSSIFFGGLCTPEEFKLDNANFWTELSVNGTICVPEVKPCIESIDSINTKIEILKTEVIITPAIYRNVTDDSIDVTNSVRNLEGKITTGRKLIVEGLLCFSVTYVSTNLNQSVHSFHGQIPFSAYIIVPYQIGRTDSLDINYQIASCLEDVMVKAVNERCISICAAFVLQAIPSDKMCDDSYLTDSGIPCNFNINSNCNHEYPCMDHEPMFYGVCSLKKIKPILDVTQVNRNTSNCQWTELFVPEILNIPDHKPDIEQILSVTSNLDIICQKVILSPQAERNHENLVLTGKKLVIEAVLRQRITYVSTSDCHSVHSAHFDIPLSALIVVHPNTNLTDKFRITACIEHIYACALNPRQIFKNTTLFLKADNITCINP
ncbi:DUF3794 domain-containing protein [Clostridium tarantellae]|uniref:DUF3794 domain-containing protein n=1 Tax=Clostridium tarantellae TaxID=39493 RepID=A0A6I1MJU8_9CLOT|nr:DUF3794 domain-containing protein [Clostridium tarantellae]MPQ43214.1 DUF3794 domain-containing protein [Clostridium tarantellae]